MWCWWLRASRSTGSTSIGNRVLEVFGRRGRGWSRPIDSHLSIGFLYVLLHGTRGGHSQFGFPGVVLGPIGRIHRRTTGSTVVTGNAIDGWCIATHRLAMEGVQFQAIPILLGAYIVKIR